MKNISFDNPCLLLLFIPLLAVLIVPYILAFRRENRGKSVITSFVLHILIASTVTLAAAGTTVTGVMTETDVFVVADVSHSANRNLDLVDQYVKDVRKNLPGNSKVGVVCFGKDQQILTPLGGEPVSVRTHVADDSATDISGALDFTATLFPQGVIKRIVLITDGRETETDSVGRLIASVENLYAQNIYIDAVYLNDNLPADAKEVQLSGVDFTPSTYLNHETYAEVLIQSSYETKAICSLYKGGERVDGKALDLIDGYNVTNFELDTSRSGEFDYEIRIEAEGDESEENNKKAFTQTVAGNIKVLLIASSDADTEKIRQVYGEKAQVDAYVGTPDVPCTVEELCAYDEIMLSDVDVRTFRNVTSFVDSLDKAVSLFGKSLVTLGDTKIQNKTDSELKKLEDMLPIRYGNDKQDPKLYGLVLDNSRSMMTVSRFAMMKETAIEFLELLDKDDYVTVIAFNGDVTVLQAPTKAAGKGEIIKLIRELQPRQGTFMGKGLQTAYDLMKDLPFREKQVLLIGDGMSYTLEKDNPVEVAKNMADNHIFTSAINPRCEEGTATLRQIAKAGKGKYYEIENPDAVSDLIFGELADDVTDSVIVKDTPVLIRREKDPVMKGIPTLPNLGGYLYSSKKAGATSVLTAKYVTATGTVYENVPIYAYWTYGNGKVSSFTGKLTGDWSANWNSESGNRFFANLMETNTPKERMDHPYTLSVEYDGTDSSVELIPATLNPYAKAKVTVQLPDGSTETKELIFDSERYFYRFRTPAQGKYSVSVSYEYDGHAYTSESYFHISYSPEYDSFAVYDLSVLLSAIRNRGTVSDGTVPKLENDAKEVATYRLSFAVPLLIVSAVLLMLDIMIRKLKWDDIRGLFRRRKAKGGNRT